MKCPYCSADVFDSEKFCYKCGTDISATHIGSPDNAENNGLSENEKTVNEINNYMKARKIKAKSISYLVFAALFVGVFVLCLISRNTCFSKASEYETELDSLNSVVEEINGLKSKLREKVASLNLDLNSFSYATVSETDNDINELKEIGNNIIEKIKLAEELGYSDYSTYCNEFDVDGAVNNYKDWRKAKLEYIETDYSEYKNSNDYKNSGVNAREMERITFNIPFELKYKMDSEEILSGISGIDYKSGINSKIDNAYKNADTLFVVMIVAIAISILFLILSIYNFRKIKQMIWNEGKINTISKK